MRIHPNRTSRRHTTGGHRDTDEKQRDPGKCHRVPCRDAVELRPRERHQDRRGEQATPHSDEHERQPLLQDEPSDRVIDGVDQTDFFLDR